MGHYRPEIDGLRALAVLAVLAYHLGFAFAPGGFVGVDVFFVISGYLITRVIVNEVEAEGRFDFWRFYARRVRRILPALVAISLVTFAAAAVILPPALLAQAGASFVCALLSVSNIFFWMQSGYFDNANELKPLLHTWSLGVEEQFYLLWPVLILLALTARRYWATLLMVAIVLVASLVASLFIWTIEHRSTICCRSAPSSSPLARG